MKYIAAQGTLTWYEDTFVIVFLFYIGPMRETITHFWRMMWEYKIQVIVMLTRCVEMSRVCHNSNICSYDNSMCYTAQVCTVLAKVSK